MTKSPALANMGHLAMDDRHAARLPIIRRTQRSTK